MTIIILRVLMLFLLEQYIEQPTIQLPCFAHTMFFVDATLSHDWVNQMTVMGTLLEYFISNHLLLHGKS